jgi:hypothetical protein
MYYCTLHESPPVVFHFAYISTCTNTFWAHFHLYCYILRASPPVPLHSAYIYICTTAVHSAYKSTRTVTVCAYFYL